MFDHVSLPCNLMVHVQEFADDVFSIASTEDDVISEDGDFIEYEHVDTELVGDEDKLFAMGCIACVFIVAVICVALSAAKNPPKKNEERLLPPPVE